MSYIPFEGIFVDDKGVNYTNLEIVGAKKYLTQYFFEMTVDISYRQTLLRFGICASLLKTKRYMNSKLI